MRHRGEKRRKASTATAESIAAPPPGAGGMGGRAGVLTGGTTSDTAVRRFNRGCTAATDRPPSTMTPATAAWVENRRPHQRYYHRHRRTGMRGGG